MIVNGKGVACWIKDEKIAWKIIQGYDYALLSDKNNALNSVKRQTHQSFYLDIT